MTFDLDAFRQQILTDPLAHDVWDVKYRHKAADGTSLEATVADTRARVVNAVYAQDPDGHARDLAMSLVQGGYLVPAGRVNAGAGLDRRVTLLNCFVNRTVPDNLVGIQRAITDGALTMQQGGGIGTSWSTVRPAGALVKQTGSVSSGVIPFMDQMSAMCETIESGGDRRGAMMGTLADDHPDLWNERHFETRVRYDGVEVLAYPSFISAKRQRGRLTQFNVSVMVSDRLLAAVEADAGWDLGFHVPRADGQHVAVYDRPLRHDVVDYANDGTVTSTVPRGSVVPWYVYRRVRARVLWEDLMRSTYTYAEPGVIYVDRVNRWNNLDYCEDIDATNPCGEQPLPPYGTCCLGSVNLAFMVRHPFTDAAKVAWGDYEAAISAGVRFLDNVLTVTRFPLAEQQAESDSKRRVGLGVTGFASMLAQLGIRYGSDDSVALADELSRNLKEHSYRASAYLAKERGVFPLYDQDRFNQHNLHGLDTFTRDLIKKHGLRNGVLNTVAPNGTISLYTGNVSNGIEPIFSTRASTRRVRQHDGTYQTYDVVDYAQRLWHALHPGSALPEYVVGAHDVSPFDHLRVQGAWQRHVDAAISKTVNVDTATSFEDFKHLYTHAYEQGCKGCTTYRYDPASGRGSVLTEVAAPAATSASPLTVPTVRPRPPVVEGRTYKLTWPPTGTNSYLTVTNDDGRPLELFITHNDAALTEWTNALSRMVTGNLRRGGDVRYVIEQLEQVGSSTGGAFVDGRYRPSVVAAIAGKLELEFRRLGVYGVASPTPPEPAQGVVSPPAGERCPACGDAALIRDNGCKRCLTCGHEACG